jgi:hypothetical protein
MAGAGTGVLLRALSTLAYCYGFSGTGDFNLEVAGFQTSEGVLEIAAGFQISEGVFEIVTVY